MVNFISRSFTEKRGAEVESLLRINLVTAASNEGAFIIKSKCLMFFNVFFFFEKVCFSSSEICRSDAVTPRHVAGLHCKPHGSIKC